MHRCALTFAVCLAVLGSRGTQLPAADLKLSGLTVTPHVQAPNLRWRVPPDPHLGVRAELFLRNASDSAILLSAVEGIRFDGQTPGTLMARQQWTWHDTPERWNEPALQLPAGALTVLRFNTRTRSWGVGTDHAFAFSADDSRQITFEQPDVWISAATFPGTDLATQPTSLIVFVANQQKNPVRITSCRLWLPAGPGSLHIFQESLAVEQLTLFPDGGRIPAGEKGGFVAQCTPLPLTYCVVQVDLTLAFAQPRSLFAYLRIKPEVFDISSGEPGRFLFGRRGVPNEPYLKTLKCMHINTAHTRSLPRYTGDDDVLDSHPWKLFGWLSPVEQFDRDQVLARVHAVDIVGKPQFGGRTRRSPQEVLEQLAPYQATRLPTTMTHSDERVWRQYAGLSDYPDFQAFRVTVPSADDWPAYERWDGRQISWGAPLETIGDLTRNLRELNRPKPIACWSQAACKDWLPSGGRLRASPTADELRAQAYHALANRITSLYWFNVDLSSLLKYPDLIGPIARINHEIRLIDEFLVCGDAYQYRRILSGDRPDWDLSSIAARDAAVLFAHDLAYRVEPDQGVFEFQKGREAEFLFRLPAWLRAPVEVFRVDAAGTHNVECQMQGDSLAIRDRVHVVGVYVAACEPGLREQIQQEHAQLLDDEQAIGFDPGANVTDLQTLRNAER